jgi:predicted ATP-dependent serine protease
MSVNHLHRCYGRNEHIENLQRIFHEFRRRGYNHSCLNRHPDCLSTVATEGSTASTSTSKDDGRISHGSSIVDDCLSCQGNCASSDCRLILISGPNGCGKSTLVYEALNSSRHLAKKCCHETSFLQVSGQFRVYQEDEDQNNPYSSGRSREFEYLLSAFRDALREMIDILLQDVDTTHTILERLKD